MLSCPGKSTQTRLSPKLTNGCATSTPSFLHLVNVHDNVLFRSLVNALVNVLFRSLVLPLFDYCAAVVHPQLKTLNDALEKTVHTFLRTVNLGVPLNASPDVKYSIRLMQLGMEPLAVRRLKSALSMAYKLLFGRIPFANYFFEPFIPVASASLVAGNTRDAHQRLQHPRPIQVVKKSDSAVLAHGSSRPATSRTRGPADGSFSDIIQKIWNDLPFAEYAYASLGAFKAALEDLD